MSYLVDDAGVGKILLVEIHKAELLPGPLGGVEDVGDAELGEQPRVLRRPPVPDKEAGTDLMEMIMMMMIVIIRNMSETRKGTCSQKLSSYPSSSVSWL